MTTQEKVYLDAQAACGLKVGDWVRVTRQSKKGEAGWAGVNPFDTSFMVGGIYQIDRVGNLGIAVKRDNPNFISLFPYFVLEKVKKPTPRLKPFDRVLARDTDLHYWRPDFFAYFNEGAEFPYVCTSKAIYAQCIPYEGNEHLAGTTEKAE